MLKHLLFFILLAIALLSCKSEISEHMTHAHTNELINETSPYLLQHAHNPVNWKAWNDNTLNEAKSSNKLILISVGYAACHWCHVMEEESFEDSLVAKVMNTQFINIKVDREERPDVDQVYMNAVQLMTGSGGWPLNVIALPDGRPVWGGTYFKKEQWLNVLKQIAIVYKDTPEKLLDYADKLEAGIKSLDLVSVNNSEVDFKHDFITEAIEKWGHRFDTIYGGVNGAPKFMMPNNIQFLMREAYQNNAIELVSLYLPKLLIFLLYISYILLLSLFFIFIIVIAFSSSLYQLVKQKKISEIKTDFINNMTHEFKTPIATINLALDSIKNPKIINDQDKVLRYIKMIRDENKRMHGQVENVLRISRLEKNQIEISTEALDLHDVIDDAISHVNLLTLDKKGSINTHLEAIQSEILANHFHMTNVLVNILENALKYSEGKPKIDVFTESTNKNLLVKIEDKGIGMSKNVQKNIFDKFYREQKGNIHDVKGHGLGLAYVKEIIDIHHGTVFVDSEKGKGSTFTIKLPLI